MFFVIITFVLVIVLNMRELGYCANRMEIKSNEKKTQCKKPYKLE